ncbi:MAG TPA: HAD-IA family hydrolase [Pseudonocardia sp.]|uniref:HAD-IA family hydrolase n=1 Tax=Pseudonocardia sp. TaxID=60912 RepID=UPI002B4B12C3|nr:HAD-IA family hydrolase [Pseudonocardia sp.]HLU57035.1 HAD-IA family hydrolase [Pseudonocardia sp.]
MAPQLRAVIFDVDGTLADTERDGHRPAFNAAFAEHGIDVEWGVAEYGRLLQITGGARRIAADLRDRGVDGDVEDIAARVHRTKTALFTALVTSGAIVARPGLPELVADLAAAGIRLAVATTGRRTWVEPLVERLLAPHPVEVVVTGDDVAELKPHPEGYERALSALGLPAREALAVEDSAVGLRAATAAGLATVVVTNGYTADQDFSGAAAVLPGFDGPDPLRARRLRDLHRRWWAAGAVVGRGRGGT